MLSFKTAKQGNLRWPPINHCVLSSSKQNSSQCSTETKEPEQSSPKLPGNPRASSTLAYETCCSSLPIAAHQLMELVCEKDSTGAPAVYMANFKQRCLEIFVGLTLVQEMPQLLQGTRHFPTPKLCFHATVFLTDITAGIKITRERNAVKSKKKTRKQKSCLSLYLLAAATNSSKNWTPPLRAQWDSLGRV